MGAGVIERGRWDHEGVREGWMVSPQWLKGRSWGKSRLRGR